jgi:general stress protein 26
MAQEHQPLRVTHDRKHLCELLQSFSTMMLGTFEQTGDRPALRARPMHVARVEDDGSLYFLTRNPSEKLDEAAATQTGHVFAQSEKQFISMSGEISISTDRQTIRDLWKTGYGVWLDGPDDPHAALMIFKPHEAELWDASGLKGLRFLIESAKSLVTGDKGPKYPNQMHERVELTR